jgi:hypothetical protein
MSVPIPPSAEAWLRGPIDGIDPLLQPVAHAVVQARDDAADAVHALPDDLLWTAPPGTTASPGFQLIHLAGALDRLFTYARGDALSEAQGAALKAEKRPGTPPPSKAQLLERIAHAVDAALAQLRATPAGSLADPREVGRARLPSTVIGLLFHAAEHSTRHAGQLLTTVKIVRALAEQRAAGHGPG